MKYRSMVRIGIRLMLTVAGIIFFLPWKGVANSFVVRNSADAGVHSLRWAIQQANIKPGLDVITFDIPGEGPFIITPRSPLPPLTDSAGVVIDAISQSGATAGSHPPSTLSLLIRIDGTHAGDAPGLWVLSSHNLIRGLVITGFREDGIRIQGTMAGTRSNEIRHCIVGMDVDGRTPLPNGTDTRSGRWGGIRFASVFYEPGPVEDNTAFQNLISGNECDGILLMDSKTGSVHNNTIKDNLIGTDISGTHQRGNARNGILILGGCSNNTISGNIIGGNLTNGIHVVGEYARSASARRNRIGKNHIGVSREMHDIGNTRSGIYLGGPETPAPGGYVEDNEVLNNVIAWNGRAGIALFEHPATSSNADGNRLSQNSIFANRGRAIALEKITGTTAGDIQGGERVQDAPGVLEFQFLDAFSGVTVLRGSVSGVENPTSMRVEVYRYVSEVKNKKEQSLYLGNATPDGAGNWAFSTTHGLTAGDRVTALVIDADGNTSEFTTPHTVNMGGGYSMNTPMKPLKKSPPPKRVAVVSESKSDRNTGATTFTLTVEKDCWGILEVYTPGSELVSTLIDRWLPAGSYSVTWDGTNWRGDRVEAGTYVCRLDAAGGSHNVSVTLN